MPPSRQSARPGILPRCRSAPFDPVRDESRIEPMARTALVLGAGDAVGVAWQAGVLAGLADVGFDLGADRVIGTSCGALLAARLTSGVPAQHLAETIGGELVGSPPVPWTARLRMASVPWHPSHLRAVQAIGLSSMRRWSRAWQSQWVGWVAPELAGKPWPDTLVIVASNAVTGRPMYFTGDQPVDLATAVAASWAVPGVQPAVRVEAEWSIDGRLRTPLNLDIAAGFDSIVAVSPRAGLGDLRRCEAWQARGLRGEGCTVRRVQPDVSSRLAMRAQAGLGQGVSMIVASGRRQGRTFGEQLAGHWPG